MGRSTLCTIGYQGKTVEELIVRLKRARVNVLVDVRELPLSRRRGFSKTALRDALQAEGIAYVHLRAAGNPHRAQRADGLRLYAEHLERSPVIIDWVMAEIRGQRAALLCFEAQPGDCHRSVLAERLKVREPGLEILHL